MTATGKTNPTTPGERLRKSVMGPEVICWPALPPDKEQAVTAEMVEWVTWLTRRYDLDRRTIPECWGKHGALVEELSALRSAWQLAFSRTAPKDAPLTWHSGFAQARARLADWAARAGCRPGRHQESGEAGEALRGTR
jgi:hypothetical protein